MPNRPGKRDQISIRRLCKQWYGRGSQYYKLSGGSVFDRPVRLPPAWQAVYRTRRSYIAVPNYRRIESSTRLARRFVAVAMKAMRQSGLLLAAAAVTGCAQADPLSITMLNPKTNQVVKCTARQNSGAPETS